MNKLKVLFLTSSPTPYKNPILESIAACSSIDLFVCFCVWKSATRPWDLNPLKGVRYQVLSGLHVPVGKRNFLRFNFSIFRHLIREQPDVVVISGYNQPTMLFAIIYCFLFRKRYIVQGETWKHRRRFVSILKKWLIFPLVLRANGFLVTGRLATQYWESYGISPEIIRVFANTPDVNYYEAQSNEVSPQAVAELKQNWNDEGRPIGICVCRLIDAKAVDVLIESVKTLPSCQRPLIVIAGDGIRRTELENAAKGLPIRFIGFLQQDQLPATYRAADFFVLVSRHEPWGVVVNEAMACGLPLVLSDQVGAHLDLLDNSTEGNGILAKGPTVRNVAESLEWMTQKTDSERKVLGSRSREIIQDWKYEVSVDNFIDLCHQVADREFST